MHTVDTKEIAHFASSSSQWWDEDGPFAPLHRLNPARLGYFKDMICGHFGRDLTTLKPYTGLKILDIGCGGGLVCEPMVRLGADVTGIDADANAIAVATDHGARGGLTIQYRNASTDDLIALPPKKRPAFDVVLALEIVEHVADVDKFVEDCVDLCAPGGIIIFSTLNRTAKSFVLGKIAAEYILGWVPKGTHDWKKFVKPSELARAVRKTGAKIASIEGLAFDPLTREFKRDAADPGVNYFLTAQKR